MTVTMPGILRAVEDAEDARWRTPEGIAEVIGCSPDDPTFVNLIASMTVSGYIHRRGRGLHPGPNVLRAVALPARVAGPPRRPRVDAQPPAQDKLRVAARIPLADGEAPAGSGALTGKEGAVACFAGVTTPAGPTVRVSAPIWHENKRDWCGADDGGTVVLDDDGVDELGRAVEGVIAAADAAVQEYRRRERDMDAAGDARVFWESKRYDPEMVEQRLAADWRVNHDEQAQRRRGADMQRDIDALDSVRRAAYDALESEFQQHADVHGDDDARRRARQARRDVRARQAELVTALTADEAHQLFAMADANTSRLPYRESRALGEQMDALYAKAGTSRWTWGPWLNVMMAHESAAAELDSNRAAVDALEAQARPVDPATAAQIQAAQARYVAAEASYDQIAGMPISTVEVAGQWGALVVQAIQGEEGNGHRYLVETKPADAGDDWEPCKNNEAWPTTAAKLRGLAEAVRQMRDAATPPGYRRRPAGVPPVPHPRAPDRAVTPTR